MDETDHDFPIPPVDDRLIYDAIWLRAVLPATLLAQEIDLFQRLENHPATILETAAAYGVAPQSAEALLAVLAAFGFLQRNSDGRYRLSDVGRTYLIKASRFYYGSLSDPHLDLLRQAFHGGGWSPPMPASVDVQNKSETDVRGYIGLMNQFSMPPAAALARQGVFGEIGRLLDVAGGSGAISAAVAGCNPHIHCTILDLPSVCEIGRTNVRATAGADRVIFQAADMFHDVWPHGHDAVLMSNVFHDWDVDTCQGLARRAFAALPPGGKILLHEMLMDETKDGPVTVACLNVFLLISEKGKQYTESELAEMLQLAGFVDVRATPTFGYYSLVSARKP